MSTRHRFLMPSSCQPAAWLLWLALLLPTAQLFAAGHAVSHHRVVAAADDDTQRGLPAPHCDLCLVSAAIGDGALPADAGAVPDTAAVETSPAFAVATIDLPPSDPAYRSRAPPISPH